MPFRWFKCPLCGIEYRTKKESPQHCEKPSELMLTAPGVSVREKGQLVNQESILRERARNHSRDHSMDDLIQKNGKQVVHQSGWLNENGQKRKKIDDV